MNDVLLRYRREISWRGGGPPGWRGPWVIDLLVVAIVLRIAGQLDERTAGALLATGVPLAAPRFFASRIAARRSGRQWLGLAGADSP